MAQRGLLPGAASSLTLGSRASTPTPSLEDSTEGAKFRKTVTWKVRNSLRAWGDLRLAELVMGELPPSVQGGDDGDAGGAAALAASLGESRAQCLRPAARQLGPRRPARQLG